MHRITALQSGSKREGGSRGRGRMYIPVADSMLMCSRNQHNIVM